MKNNEMRALLSMEAGIHPVPQLQLDVLSEKVVFSPANMVILSSQNRDLSGQKWDPLKQVV